MSLVDNRLDELIVERLSCRPDKLDLDDWRELLHRLRNPEHEISIAVVGKYAEHRDAYKSIYEALDHAGIAPPGAGPHPAGPERGGRTGRRRAARWPARRHPGARRLWRAGDRGQGRSHPLRPRAAASRFFGICLGMQCAVIEFARNVVGLDGAHSTEFDKDTPHPVICLLDEQKTITDKGGTMRLGAQPTISTAGSKPFKCYGPTRSPNVIGTATNSTTSIASSTSLTA